MPTTKAAVMVIERESGDCVMVDSLRKEGANKLRNPPNNDNGRDEVFSGAH